MLRCEKERGSVFRNGLGCQFWRPFKHDVWLLTDVLDPARLSAATAARFYRWRWRNEGVFRIYKRTVNKLKLSGRTVRQVHREAELSLLATQILLAHADALADQVVLVAAQLALQPRELALVRLLLLRRPLGVGGGEGLEAEAAGDVV